MPNTMAILDRSGDIKTIWDPHNADEVAHARDTFQEFREKGYLAYRPAKDGSKGEMVTTFDPAADSLILTPPMVGG